MARTNIVLFDLDNTLADMNHRLHYTDGDNPDWESFEDACVLDSPIQSSILLTQALACKGFDVWIWTGRSDQVEQQTREWLAYQDVYFDQLIMRPYGDESPTSELKRRWLKDNPIPWDRVLCAFDDDPKVIKMLLEEGVDAFQVRRGEGDGLRSLVS